MHWWRLVSRNCSRSLNLCLLCKLKPANIGVTASILIDFEVFCSSFPVIVHFHQANCLEYLSQQKLFMWPYFDVPFVQLEGCKYFRNYIDFGWLQSFMFFFVIWFFFFPAPSSYGRCQLVSSISSCGFLLMVFLDSKQSIICIDSNWLEIFLFLVSSFCYTFCANWSLLTLE